MVGGGALTDRIPVVGWGSGWPGNTHFEFIYRILPWFTRFAFFECWLLLISLSSCANLFLETHNHEERKEKKTGSACSIWVLSIQNSETK